MIQEVGPDGATKNSNFWSGIYTCGWHNFVCFIQASINHGLQKKQECRKPTIIFISRNCLNFYLQNIQSKLYRGFEQLEGTTKKGPRMYVEEISPMFNGE